MESEKDTGEPKEKKTFSMSISKPLGTKPGGGLSVSDSQEKKTFSMNISKSLAKPGSGLAKVPPFGLGSSKQGMSTDVKSTSGKPVPIKMALSSQVGTCMGESFQDYSCIQDFEADFLWKVSLKMLN